MKKAIAFLILLAGTGGCNDSSDPTGIDGSMVPVVIIDGIVYGPHDSAVSSSIGEVYATVKRKPDCEGIWLSETSHLDDYCPLEDGESNFLPAGTKIYSVIGAEPSKQLAYYNDFTAEWTALVAISFLTCKGADAPPTLDVCASS